MNTRAAFGALGPGAISIVAGVADDRICSVRVASSRPTHLTRLFIGRPAREIPILAERLYSLCGLSHALAASLAIAAARGEGPKPGPRDDIALLCERVSEGLRSSAMMAANGGDAAILDAAALRPLRDILALTRELSILATAPADANARPLAVTAALTARIRAAAEELGLPAQPRSVEIPPRKGSWFGDLWRQVEDGAGFAANVPDALGVDDDAAIVDGLRHSGERFAAAPRLPGRTPETGAFARHWGDTDFSRGALPARLHARMIDLALSFERLARAGAEGCEIRSNAPAAGEGFATIETSRGDLYHWARLTQDDKIADYAIVAPTEWNFHPAGPFVAALLGARIPRVGALRSIALLAGLFDPCVVFRVEVQEAAHA